MKSATIPPLRVTPEMRSAAENVLREGETLSNFVEESVRSHIERRQMQQEFIARGLAARDKARSTGTYFTQAEVMASLRGILKGAEGKQKQKRRR